MQWRQDFRANVQLAVGHAFAADEFLGDTAEDFARGLQEDDFQRVAMGEVDALGTDDFFQIAVLNAGQCRFHTAFGVAVCQRDSPGEDSVVRLGGAHQGTREEFGCGLRAIRVDPAGHQGIQLTGDGGRQAQRDTHGGRGGLGNMGTAGGHPLFLKHPGRAVHRRLHLPAANHTFSVFPHTDIHLARPVLMTAQLLSP